MVEEVQHYRGEVAGGARTLLQGGGKMERGRQINADFDKVNSGQTLISAMHHTNEK